MSDVMGFKLAKQNKYLNTVWNKMHMYVYNYCTKFGSVIIECF